MFRGNYHFFDYKYNIPGYTGQDHGSIAQYLYLSISIILIIVLLYLLRKSSRERVLHIIRGISIFLILFYIVKTSWESYYDIQLSGSFNTGLLPLDTCSLIMLAGVLAGFTKGKIERIASCWLATGGVLGGFATMILLNAFYYYPFLSFGAFYSMIWHFLMVFLGLLMIVTGYVDCNYKTILSGFFFHILFSILVIPIDFIFQWDFMMYYNLGSIPFFEGIASNLTMHGFRFLNPFMMLVLYFLAYHLSLCLGFGIKAFIFKMSKII